MSFTIDKELRRVIVGDLKQKMTVVVINEFDKLEKAFLENTSDKYECELVLLDVDVMDENMNVVGKETKAFARRVGKVQWLMEFNTEEYSKSISV